jgi:hypothetical protein
MIKKSSIRFLGRILLSATKRGRILPAVFICLGICFLRPALAAQDTSREQMQGLDEQVQEIKSDVLSIAAELDNLEERLLYPSNTQMAVFVSLADGDEFRLDSVEIRIDDEPVAYHIYSFKELEALQKGGVQRIYTGNVPTGPHKLDVSIAGKSAGGHDFSAADSFSFNKDVEPKLVAITLNGPDAGGGIQLGDW